MDLRKLKTLIDLVSDSNVSELEITEAEGTVRIVKSAPAPVAMVTQMAAPVAVAAPVATAPAAAAPVVEAVPAGHTVKSPMVGTFYRSSSPGAKSFAEVGQQVKEGDTICIIEAMKLFNEIESEISGKIVKVLVANATPVEYDQPLFLVDPAG